MRQSAPLFFALGQTVELGSRVAAHFGLLLSPHEEREFSGGEHKARPLVDVAGRNVVVVHSAYGDAEQSANDKLCRLLFFLGALRDAGAAFIVAVLPYMPYARKDRRTKPNDPVTTRYVAKLFAAVRVDAVVNLNVHNPAAQENAFHECQYCNLDGATLFADHFAGRTGENAVTVVAPDTGAVKNAQLFQQQLLDRGIAADLAFMTKTRSQDIVTSSSVFGEIRGRTVIIYDDLISSGTTIGNAIQHCSQDAREVYVAAIHGSFTAEADRLLNYPVLREVVISDSVVSDAIDRRRWERKLQILDSSALFADFLRNRLAIP